MTSRPGQDAQPNAAQEEARGEAQNEAYLWIWLPGATTPVVAGRVVRDGERLIFNYGQSYLDRKEVIPIFEPDLPLRRGAIAPAAAA